MTTTRFTTRTLAGLVLSAGYAAAVPPAPKAEEMADTKPRQPGVAVTTPTGADLGRCRVEPVQGNGGPVGYVLKDAAGRPVRRFIANGTKEYNILSFYLDGQEVYRETDTRGAGKIDQFRWLGAAGSKTGRDADGNGSIDAWDVLSPEEASKEVFESLVKNDAARLNALLVSEADLKAIGLPAAEVQKIGARVGQAAQRLAATAGELKLTPSAKWVHLELWAPETTPADAFGGTQDVVRHRNAGVLIDAGDGKNVVTFQLGELVQVGKAWKLIDGPAPGTPQPPTAGDAAATGPAIPKEIVDLVAKLPQVPPGDHAGRAKILDEVVTKLHGTAQQTDWLKQLLDACTAGAEAGDKGMADKLFAWKKQIDQHAPKTPLAGFVAFRAVSVEYSAKQKAAKGQDEIAAAQKWYIGQLEGFVKEYPSIDETAEAIQRLAMSFEFAPGKENEDKAVEWYGKLAKEFPSHPMAAHAQGAVRRMNAKGQAFQLVGPNLATGQPLNAAVPGKVVIVYFWGSFHPRLKEDATALTELMQKHNAKGLEVITVCLDSDRAAAVKAINNTSLPGLHMFKEDGSLAAAYGVMGTHTMLVGKDGRVANKNAQVPLMGEQVEELLGGGK